MTGKPEKDGFFLAVGFRLEFFALPRPDCLGVVYVVVDARQEWAAMSARSSSGSESASRRTV